MLVHNSQTTQELPVSLMCLWTAKKAPRTGEKPQTQEEHAKSSQHFNQNVKKYFYLSQIKKKRVPCETNPNICQLYSSLSHNILCIAVANNVLFRTKASGTQREAGNETSPGKKVFTSGWKPLSLLLLQGSYIVQTVQRTVVSRQHEWTST